MRGARFPVVGLVAMRPTAVDLGGTGPALPRVRPMCLCLGQRGRRDAEVRSMWLTGGRQRGPHDRSGSRRQRGVESLPRADARSSQTGLDPPAQVPDNRGQAHERPQVDRSAMASTDPAANANL